MIRDGERLTRLHFSQDRTTAVPQFAIRDYSTHDYLRSSSK